MWCGSLCPLGCSAASYTILNRCCSSLFQAINLGAAIKTEKENERETGSSYGRFITFISDLE